MWGLPIATPGGILDMDSQERAGNNEQQRVSDAIQGNLEKVEEFQRREDAKRSPVQKLIERVSIFFSSPRFLVMFLSTTVAWIGGNILWHYSGHPYFDEPPFFMLQGVVSYIGVLITMAVLVRQNRMAQGEESRAHLELQVNLLAEQKATKIIMLLEELRRDMPDVRNRHDEHAKTLQAMTNPDDVLAEIESRHVVSGEKRDDDAAGIQSAQ